METKGYIFDYGGTIDTDGCHWGKMIWHAYERQQVPIVEEAFREAYVFAERTLGANPIIQPDYTFRKTLEIKLRIEFDYLQERGYINTGNLSLVCLKSAVLNDLYERVMETVAFNHGVLKQLNNCCPMVLVSNFYGNISVILKEFGLNDLFQQVIESAVVGIRKPDSRIYALGVQSLGMKADEVTVVGDSLDKDIAPAQKIGCRTVWLRGEPWENANLAIQPNYTISTLSELLQLATDMRN